MGANHQATFTPFIDGLDHPECVTLGPDGNLYAGGEAGQVYRVGLDGSLDLVGTTGGFALGVCMDGDLNAYVCDVKRFAWSGSRPTGPSRCTPTASPGGGW